MDLTRLAVADVEVDPSVDAAISVLLLFNGPSAHEPQCTTETDRDPMPQVRLRPV
jgi:hypothetical protein